VGVELSEYVLWYQQSKSKERVRYVGVKLLKNAQLLRQDLRFCTVKQVK
jgi:hypothetical protein